jgi:hypothetical protein
LRRALAGAPAVFFVAFFTTFLVRWLSIDFDNDYFMHVAWAAEMLRGQWPVRDFVEPGFIGQTLLSFAGFRVGGYQLAWEGVIACTAIAAGAAFTYSVCRRITASRALAAIVVAIAVFSFPRLYAYPKALVYPAALWAIAVYARRRDRRSLLPIAVVIAVAFLLRHDHGVWIAAAATLSVVLVHGWEWRQSAQALTVCGSIAALLVAPFVLYVALSGHADQYLGFLLGQGGGLISNRIAPDRTFGFDTSQPLVTLAPLEYPFVGIRWAPAVSERDRQQLETRYGLDPVPGRTNQYRIRNVGRENVTELLLDPLVEDTNGIDRRWRLVPSGLFAWSAFQVRRYFPPARLRVAPGVIAPRNALPWFTWVTFVLPFAVLATALVRIARAYAGSRISDTPYPFAERALILPAALLGIITYQTIVRGSPDSRLGDVAGVTAILLCWISARAWAVPGMGRLAARSAVVALVALTLVSAVSYGQVFTRLAAARIDGPPAVWRRARDMAARYSARPLEVFSPRGATGLPLLSRWLNECTAETDRVSVIGFEPQVFVVAERGFAGGTEFYDLAWNSSPTDQALTIERWSRQNVPVVIAMESEWNAFSRDYPQVRTWIDQRYHEVHRSSFGGGKPVTILVDKTRPPTGTHADTQLPCFTDG